MRAILAALAGAVVLFVWGVAFWMGLSDAFGGLRQFDPEQEQAIVDVIKAQAPETGVYYFPGMPTHGKDLPEDESRSLNDAWEARHRAGPLGMVIYTAQGKEVMEPILFFRGFVINLASTVLVSILVIMAGPGGFAKRWAVVAIFGAGASVATHVVDWNWMYTPADYTLMTVADTTFGWILAGLVIAAILPASKRKPG